MPLISRKTISTFYVADDADVKRIRLKKAIVDLTAWNTPPTGITAASDADSAIISKSTRRAGCRPRYFLYAATPEASGIYTTLYLKVPVLNPANFTTPPSGSASFAYLGLTYNLVKAIKEDND